MSEGVNGMGPCEKALQLGKNIDECMSQMQENPEIQEAVSKLSQKERAEYTNARISMMKMAASILYIETGRNFEHTLHNIAENCNLTSERVRQVENEALKKLRKRHPAELAECMESQLRTGTDNHIGASNGAGFYSPLERGHHDG